MKKKKLKKIAKELTKASAMHKRQSKAIKTLYNMGGYKARYNAGGLKQMYQGGGMYSDNTVQAAGQGLPGSTSHIVFDESNPAVLQQKMDFLNKTKEDALTSSSEMALSLEEQAQIDKQNIAQANIESKDKFTKGESIVKGGLEKTPKLIKGAKKLFAPKTAADPLNFRAGSKLLGDQPLNLSTNLSGASTGVSGTGLQGVSGLSLGAAPKGLGATSLLNKSSSLFKPLNLASPTFTPNAALMGSKPITLGTDLAAKGSSALGKTGATTGATTAASTGMAGAGPIGIASALGGAALKHWGGDDDPTELNAAEWGGELLEGAGTGIGVAGLASGVASAIGAGALWGSAVPGLGTAIGAVAGLGYGAYKALTGRKAARKAEKKAKEARKVKVDKYNRELTSNLLSARAQARAGEMEQKTYSGYDLGRNITAKYGGMRYAKGGMKMGMPRYGYVA
tara:strand:+ start:13327 stop:14682 length:1356 start_codon:yes stop_codon:yes gene_type:complete